MGPCTMQDYMRRLCDCQVRMRRVLQGLLWSCSGCLPVLPIPSNSILPNWLPQVSLWLVGCVVDKVPANSSVHQLMASETQ
jgi:hypothetical protein